MKCNFCGANIKSSDEICPECGKYAAEDAQNNYAEKETENKLGKIIESFDYKEGLMLYCAVYIIVGVFLSGSTLKILLDYSTPYYSPLFNPHSFFDVLLWIMPVLGVLSVVCGIVSYFRLKNCFVSVSDCAIYGIIPVLPFKTEPFEIFFDEIEKIQRKGFGGYRHSMPRIIITTAKGKTVIYSPNHKHTKAISDHLYSLVDM